MRREGSPAKLGARRTRVVVLSAVKREGSPGEAGARRRRFPFWGAGGFLVFAAGLWVLARDVPGWNTVWYVSAWYGYLLVLDAVLFLRRGRSFVSHDRGTLAWMLIWSVPFWSFFEACNLVLRNWYYVFGLRNPAAAALLTAVSFATVLPACLFHSEFLGTLGARRRSKPRPVPIPSWAPGAVAAFGAVALALSLLLPQIAFPLVWFAPLGLDAVNFRSGAPSLLRDLQEGDRGRLSRLVAGGLWAGVLWELFNAVARCKWIYAVPGFERFKVFEMPLAGFLGFPVLAVGAFCFFSAASAVRRWPVGRHGAALAFAALFCAAVYPALQRQTVRSLRPLLEELSSLDAPARERLVAAGIQTPERLLRASLREGIAALSERSGVSVERLRQARDESVLALLKGMGVPRARLLESAGIGHLEDLAREDADALWRRLAALAPRLGQKPPRLSEVRVWVRAAPASPDGRPRR